jgi:hypothetical protein
MATACSQGGASTTATPTQTQQIQQPIEASLSGPIPPYVPGGPQVKMTLKNVSNSPVVEVTANLDLGTNVGPNSGSFTFPFNVSQTTPLMPSQSLSESHIFIGAGFSNTFKYPVKLTGTLQGGVKFDYTLLVQISAPATN